jgi:hypothetical protein
MKRAGIAYFVIAGIIVVAGLSYAIRERKPCIALYGVGSAHDSVDDFISCEDDNMALIYMTQFCMVLGIVTLIVLFVVIDLLSDHMLCRWYSVRRRLQKEIQR